MLGSDESWGAQFEEYMISWDMSSMVRFVSMLNFFVNMAFRSGRGLRANVDGIRRGERGSWLGREV